MITLGSISREAAQEIFEFLAPEFRGRRAGLRSFTHTDPEFVFWVSPEGTLVDAKDGHKAHPPKGFEHIVREKPDYGGFLRGRVARRFEHQLIVLYCRPELLAENQTAMRQFLHGLQAMPLPIDETALVISDNGDIYGTVQDIAHRAGW